MMNIWDRIAVWSVGVICLCLASVPTVLAICPSGCICFQRTVRCVRARLTAVPQLPADTVVLDLRFNHINQLPAGAFGNLAQLTTLFLNENGITKLHADTFKGLHALRYLYLSNNQLTQLPEHVFQQLDQLEAIYLENNQISTLEPGTFRNLPRLNRLFLYHNKITSVPAGTFINLPAMRRLRLDANNIDCDCGVYALWRHYRPLSERAQVVVALTCATPAALRQHNFAQLQEGDFRCRKPEIVEAPHDMRPAMGDSIELRCQVVGEPDPEIIWMQNTNEISIEYAPKMQILPSGSLQINEVDANDVGIYECIGRNEMGVVKAPPVRLVLDDSDVYANSVDEARVASPQFTIRPQDLIVGVGSAAPAVLDCSASGHPEPEIQWYFNGRLIDHSTPTTRIQANNSLVVIEPMLLAAGTYRCEASNQHGRIQAEAKIDVRELPEILVAPQNQTVRLGRTFVLECDADGNPLPAITWHVNDIPLLTSGRIMLENENTELVVRDAVESDSGVYTCIAENENGRTSSAAEVTVEPGRSPPRLIVEPYDLEAIGDTTIEIPCKADDNVGVKITWRRDGRTIDPNVFVNEKYQIGSTGSLFIRNVTVLDNGRYECSVKNEFGRATASARLRVKTNAELAPGDRFVRIAFEEAAREIDLAINNTVDMLFSPRNNSTNSSSSPANGHNYGHLLRVFRFPTGEARQLARAAEIYERTLVNIRKHVLKGDNLSISSDRYEFRDLVSRDHLKLVAELSGCMEHREVPDCTDMCYHSKYRSIDGTCNNLRHAMWGASLTAFRRLEQPIYENGFSMPIGWTKGKLYAGYPKPSARLVSTTLIGNKETTSDDRLTHMVMQWGQFVDHDLDHAIPSVSSESWDGVDCKKTCEFAPPCYPIEVPPNDPRIRNRRCIDVVRSSAICGSGMTSVFFDSVQNREQINQPTSYIDASQVYGYSYEFAQELRNLTTDDGLLRVGVHFPHQKDMLPFAAPQDGMDCRRNLDENQMSCFVAGDVRVNEQVGLLAMHTLWMREHNRIAIKLREINPHWTGNTIYQEARKIVGAQMQHITFKHWLPLIIGESGMREMGDYHGYNEHLEPSIANEFATVAFRFGHSIINPILHRLNGSFQPIPQGHLPLHKAFFAPWRIAFEGGIDPLLRGMLAVPAKLKTPEQSLNAELTEKLFHSAHAVALDLAAINIQRGRDHGIPGYNVYRQRCNMSVARTFDDFATEIRSAEVRDRLQQLYGHPDNVDVWVGGILEDQLDDAKVGPTFRCMLIEQFSRLRDADRFYYEHPSVFLPEQLAQIKQSNLGRVLCDNGDAIDRVTHNVFLLPEQQQGGLVQCDQMPGINLFYWQECNTCHTLPPIFDSYVPETYESAPANRRRRSIAFPAVPKPTPTPTRMAAMVSNELDELFDINEERVSGLEEVIGSFQRELKKLHKKLRKLEESCSRNATASAPAHNSTPIDSMSKIKSYKPKRNHYCVEHNGTTRLNNEIWTMDKCTKCECRRGQITCTKEICGKCPHGVQAIHVDADSCCPICPDAA